MLKSNKTISFLVKATKLLPTDSQFTPVVKSHYITKCRDAENSKQVTLKKSDFGGHILCKKCGNPWSEIGVIRLKCKENRTAKEKRFLRKHFKAGSRLKKFQDKIKNNQLSKLKRICKYCKYTTETPIYFKTGDHFHSESIETPTVSTNISKIKTKVTPIKPKLVVTTSKIPTIDLTRDDKSATKLTSNKKSKKKKSKDKFAGLKANVVKQVLSNKPCKGKLKKLQNSSNIKPLNKSHKQLKNLTKLANALNTSSKDKHSLMKLLK